MNKIPILLYHDVYSAAGAKGDGFAVSEENFRAQMEYLHRNGFRAVSLARLLAEREYLKGEKTPDGRLPKSGEITGDTRKKVALTFDDGDRSHFDFMFPILKDFGFSATFFVTINEIGKAGRMDWTMIYELSKCGMDIGSHAMSHAFLTGLNKYALLNELLLSKQVLEKYTRRRVDFISIPHGFYNKQVIAISRDVGFKAACVSDAGYNDLSSLETFVLKRYTMRRNYNLGTFRGIVQGAPPLGVRVPEKLRTVLRHALGYQVYDKVRQMSMGKNHRDI